MDKEFEQSLIRSAASGNSRSFRSLVENSQAFAYSLAFRFTNQHHEAEDIVQEAFIRVWNNLNRFDYSFRFKTWLGKIVTNLCLDAVKTSRKKYEVMSTEISAALHQSPGFTSDRVEAQELNEMIWDLASNLTGKQRAAFILRDLEQYDPEEICKMLNVTSQNLKSNLYHARQRIKELLIKYYGYKISAQ
ncbi:MAG: RNA polymerase sigma factor [Cyclobacteriaceae bacterium]|nr:RNA polymerase sigma factor [Cyclobacteriaceae bacterium]